MDIRDLEITARRAGAPVVPGNTLGILRGDAGVLVGVDEALARTDPQDYAKGVRVGPGFFSIPQLRPPLRSGVYTLWTRLERAEVGSFRGRIEARDAEGRCAYEFPARYDIRSLTVPAEARGEVRLLVSPEALLEPEDDGDEICVGIEWECDNGATFCLGFVIDPTPIDPPE